ncbi:MAG TPA: uroporphyrinogen decarboxylase family protein [Chloroflexota bacterium]|nr:uroporphyrinogen decarboxylase family protein [Chloroflexota bacterium]
MTDETQSRVVHPAPTLPGSSSGGMSHRERLQAALKGLPVDRTPVSFWQHFPGRDHTADLLVAATVAFQRRVDLDLVKLMPTGMYSVVDYGVAVAPSDDDLGTTRYTSGPVHGPADWARLPAVSPERGVLAREVEVVRRVRDALGPDTPIIQTIFSPFTMAAKLVGGTLQPAFLDDEATFRPALARLADDVIAFGRACLRNGADGFFFATQLASGASGDLYERYGVPYDLAVLEALRADAWAQVLHLHGPDPLFSLADRYPVDAVSWEDRETTPSLADAYQRTTRCLVGGVGRIDPLACGSAEAVAAQVREAIAQTHGTRVIVAPGCVVPMSAPERNMQALRDAV